MALRSEIRTALLEGLEENGVFGEDATEIVNDQLEVLSDVFGVDMEDDEEESEPED